MLAVLRGQPSTACGLKLGKRPMLPRQPILKGRHRVASGASRVVPAFQRRLAKAYLQARGRVAPVFDRRAAKALRNSPASGGAASKGPMIEKRKRASLITFEWIDNHVQEGLPGERRRRRCLWERRLQSLDHDDYLHRLRISGPHAS